MWACGGGHTHDRLLQSGEARQTCNTGRALRWVWTGTSWVERKGMHMDQGDESTRGRYTPGDERPIPEKSDVGHSRPVRGLRGLFRRAPAPTVQDPPSGSSPLLMAMQGAREKREGAPVGTHQTQSTLP